MDVPFSKPPALTLLLVSNTPVWCPWTTLAVTHFIITWRKYIVIWDHRDSHLSCIPRACRRHVPDAASPQDMHHGGDGSPLHNGHSSNPNGHYQLGDRGWYLPRVLAPGMSTILTSARGSVMDSISSHTISAGRYKVTPPWTWIETHNFFLALCVCEREIQWEKKRKIVAVCVPCSLDPGCC